MRALCSACRCQWCTWKACDGAHKQSRSLQQVTLRGCSAPQAARTFREAHSVAPTLWLQLVPLHALLVQQQALILPIAVQHVLAACCSIESQHLALAAGTTLMVQCLASMCIGAAQAIKLFSMCMAPHQGPAACPKTHAAALCTGEGAGPSVAWSRVYWCPVSASSHNNMTPRLAGGQQRRKAFGLQGSRSGTPPQQGQMQLRCPTLCSTCCPILPTVTALP